MISVIIPAYNVEQYIDRCLASVVNQTFHDLEIIIINDGSTDGTLEKCLEWQQYDARIKVISQENQGQGIARNTGIAQSKGEYLAFVDADDWIDQTTFDKAYQVIQQTEADVVLFNMYGVHIDEDGMIIEYEKINNPCNKRDCWSFQDDYSMFYKIIGVLWDAIWKRNCFDHIKMPDHAYEDELTVLKIFSSGIKIVSLDENLYYYNLYRKDNTTHSETSINGLELAFTSLREFFKERADFQEIYYMLRIRVLACYRSLLWNLFDINPKMIDQYEKRAIAYINQEFPQIENTFQGKCLLIGSYNLRLIVKRAFSLTNDAIDDYAMSSIISGMQKKKKVDYTIHNASNYEKEMLLKDWSGALEKRLEMMRLEEYTYVIIDFLEEVRNIIRYQEQYYTESEQIKDIIEPERYKRIFFQSAEYMVLWKKAADFMIKELKKRFKPQQIILICNYQNLVKLRMGDLQYAKDTDEIKYKLLMQPSYELVIMRRKIAELLYSFKERIICGYFDHQPQILKENEQLRKMYQYFIEHYEGIFVVNIPEEYMGTDIYFPIGAEPGYCNEAYYLQAADELKIIDMTYRESK